MIPLLFIMACEEIPDETIDPMEGQINFSLIDAPERFVYNSEDSTLTLSAKIETAVRPIKAEIVIYSPSGSIIKNSPIELIMNSEGDIYSADIPFSRNDINGNYNVEYSLISEDKKKIVGYHTIQYYNGQNNRAPMISELIMPDTVAVGQWFTFSVRVSDEDGQNDIRRVSFHFIRQENGSSSQEIQMWNDGNLQSHGDTTAGDQNYSFLNRFDQLPSGTKRTFVFSAEDFSGAKSNIISHDIYIK